MLMLNMEEQNDFHSATRNQENSEDRPAPDILHHNTDVVCHSSQRHYTVSKDLSLDPKEEKVLPELEWKKLKLTKKSC